MQNIHIIETAAWIPTKCALWVVQIRGKQTKMADGRYLEKSKNRGISATTYR